MDADNACHSRVTTEARRQIPAQVWAMPAPGLVLGVVVWVVVVAMMVSASCERRTCNNQQQEGGKKELLHAMQISTIWS